MLENYFKKLYRGTMRKAYDFANSEIEFALRNGGKCLDCGAFDGYKFKFLNQKIGLSNDDYYGVEWNLDMVDVAKENNVNLLHADLNKPLEFSDNTFRCVISLSVLEHLLNPCKNLKECFRCLEPNGTLVILTPNISTFFTMALLLMGKMPSSGPHPDSDILMQVEQPIKVSDIKLVTDTEKDNPVHRHLIVFSFRVLRTYLHLIGFNEVKGYGFGLYPFPLLLQPFFEKVDPYHCHQMVFVAKK